ncbi:hypothetical protein TNIN_495291 [Trichonephila inaurata madagascariensis]|uniref:Uncharacterized protein n=1 Tax=Trichonephila inaurata madagascariensis TaxID=2747483 RepID=A0A8X7CGZ4_9ARAC|nr:hypothetical protein TNIN_495291 [Trichonephila inaurata madagascariensis]
MQVADTLGSVLPKDLDTQPSTQPHFLLNHQMPPGENQTSKKMRRAGKEGTRTLKKNSFTITELPWSYMFTSKQLPPRPIGEPGLLAG